MDRDIDLMIGMDERARPTSPKQHELLWFLDGNVVLGTDTYLFKVHKSILSLHSSVFKDMFEMPFMGTMNMDGSVAAELAQAGRTTSSADFYEGLPLIKMADDKGEDVVHLLRTIYEHLYHDRNSDETPLETVIALLNLSTKYDFKYIRRDVIIQISRHYPTSLEESDAIEVEEPGFFGELRNDCHFPLLVAAYRANADVLLPGLFYACAGFYVHEMILAALKYQVDLEIFHTLLRGKEFFEIQANILIADLPLMFNGWRLFPDGELGCANKEVSSKTCFQRAKLITSLSGLISTHFQCTKGETIMEAGFPLQLICDGCRRIAVQSIDKKREEIWKCIPQHFGCPDWEITRSKMDQIARTT